MSFVTRSKCIISLDADLLPTVSEIPIGYAGPPWNHEDPRIMEVVNGHPGTFNYVLTAPTGEWEIGTITNDSSGLFQSMSSSQKSRGFSGFVGPISGLTLSIIVSGHNLISANAGTGLPPSCGMNSIAAGPGANAPIHLKGVTLFGVNTGCNGDGGTAIGHAAGAYTKGVAIGGYALTGGEGEVGGVAIGAGAKTRYDGEAVIRHSSAAATRLVPIVKDTSGTGNLLSILGETVDLGKFYFGVSGAKLSGFLAVRGTISITDSDHPDDSAYARLVSVKFNIWADTTAFTQAVVGTPAITVEFAGASAGAATITVDATGHVVITTAVSTLLCRGLLQIDDLQSGTGTLNFD